MVVWADAGYLGDHNLLLVRTLSLVNPKPHNLTS
jgi:hypothetical protein